MTTSPPPPAAGPPPDPAPDSPGFVAKVKEIVEDVLDSVLKPGDSTAATVPAAAPDVEAQVQKAVTAASVRQKKDAERDAQQAKISELEAKVAGMEKAPVELKKAARWLFGEKG